MDTQIENDVTKMTKIRNIFKWADRGKHWTSKQTRFAKSKAVFTFRTTQTMVLLPSEYQGSQSRTGFPKRYM